MKKDFQNIKNVDLKTVYTTEKLPNGEIVNNLPRKKGMYNVILRTGERRQKNYDPIDMESVKNFSKYVLSWKEEVK